MTFLSVALLREREQEPRREKFLALALAPEPETAPTGSMWFYVQEKKAATRAVKLRHAHP